MKFTYQENGLTIVETIRNQFTEWEFFNKDWKLHRDDGPAYRNSIGTKIWYNNGKIHREDGPAVIDSNGTKMWYKNGYLHNENGPAVIKSDGTQEFWINGKRVVQEQVQGKENNMFYVIINHDSHEYWSNEFGWTPYFNNSTLFQDEIHNLPIDGKIHELTIREIYEHPHFYSIKDAIDRAFDQFYAELQINNVPSANDDRAEKLVNHMVEYVLSSGDIKL